MGVGLQPERGESAKHYASLYQPRVSYWIKKNYLIDENTKTGTSRMVHGGLMAFDINSMHLIYLIW